ncbi:MULTISPECIES: phosphoribosyl-ATP diphosphatase [Nitrosomonas]|uniref:Phosphoribosyl-ATP pyrophosphatase n=2 Tax=Nitrosomonas eutropha TaxID=916 RepID=HIS2_NITEC|nr:MULTISPECIES: phosphoribosyl-ATP diphosphatase [Nitrosomonas]Q0AET9.1 RecName: Full=Phosphoribosyl-ATP pyrophosphatase; Short=PRA-PH [Nitrosomonas eutropha C91]ABI60143.1 phosphoribosyl-ATP pyrophosphatase [Nitrosomonas eutropha C91]MXS80860.1 phosphoribosyl-ATP diphosphatase [Nitrosomonas sp. GH22]PXV77565.1 phosphoribosyl-ATP pyrophosphatase [Nitrosomonas eutropha]SCX15074.1 phosphoribosyl-ATP pyrophosphatase [Nitrosomonas eutropha]SDW67695.1 phosphoribosyl-ATP pyrophosphatase [Nitrosomo
MTSSSTILQRLTQTIEARKSADPAHSYIAKLLSSNEDKVLKKIAEEAAETIMACKDNDREQIIYETADLWFHCLIMLARHDISPEAILSELERREGVSGIEEKLSRSQNQPEPTKAE